MAENEKNNSTNNKNAGKIELTYDNAILAISVLVFLIIMFIGLCGYFHIVLWSA